jgi:uncharacterized protein (TIGR00251 family)
MITQKENGIVVAIFAQPGSKKTCLQGVQNNCLKIRLAAKAIDGAANLQLLEYLSKLARIPKSSVTLLTGERSRQKTVFLLGTPEILTARLAKHISSQSVAAGERQ